MGTIEQPCVQRSILIITTQPTVEVALACLYYQHVGSEFKNCPFCGWQIKEIDERKTQNFSTAYGIEHTNDTCWCTCPANLTTIKFG
jgi:hypothetical protein